MVYADIALAVLAAGQAKRFGGGKLERTLDGEPLGCVAAARLAPLDFAARFAVIGEPHGALSDRFAALGFTMIVNDDPSTGLSRSLSLAVQAARQSPANTLLICLADMPNISAEHIGRICDDAAPDQVTASSFGASSSPPALFPRTFWPQLLTLSGDSGAKHLLASARLVTADAWTLRDVDTQDDYAEISRAYPPAKAPCPDPS
jgi:molybdenum cofactor cytidylyltransferase